VCLRVDVKVHVLKTCVLEGDVCHTLCCVVATHVELQNYVGYCVGLLAVSLWQPPFVTTLPCILIDIRPTTMVWRAVYFRWLMFRRSTPAGRSGGAAVPLPACMHASRDEALASPGST
jgi:hypothetical protein